MPVRVRPRACAGPAGEASDEDGGADRDDEEPGDEAEPGVEVLRHDEL